jgi:hypothetical protein
MGAGLLVSRPMLRAAFLFFSWRFLLGINSVPAPSILCPFGPLAAANKAKTSYTFFFINVGNAAQKGHLFFIAQIFHTVDFHSGNENEIIGAQAFFFDDLICLGIMFEALYMATQDIHGLVI